MKRLVLEPLGWTCRLEEAPCGPFLCNGKVCFKTEYRRDDGAIEAFCETGEAFHGEGNATEVQPLEPKWQEVDDE